MKKLILSVFALAICFFAVAQVDMEQLALDVAKADAANTEQLKAFIWKRYSTVTVDGAEKASVINEVSFDADGKIQVTQVGGETSVKQKRGVRGRIQQNAIEGNMEYFGQALELALAYTYMSKGQLLDFFEKSKLTEAGDTYVISGGNVYMEGDKLTLTVEKATLLFLDKKFSSKVGEDPIDGEIKYAKFSSGIGHGSETIMNLPGKNAVINAKNQDYTQRIN